MEDLFVAKSGFTKSHKSRTKDLIKWAADLINERSINICAKNRNEVFVSILGLHPIKLKML